MIKRTLEPHLSRLAGPFPVIFLTGPRQSGKTTLARATFPDFKYMSLEDPLTREEAQEDPRGFLSRLEGVEGSVIDEAQRSPQLFSYLQRFVDEKRSGPIVLTGSQNFLLSEKIGQSLAGRAGVLELLPFSLSELEGRESLRPEDFFDLDGLEINGEVESDLDNILVGGLFPPIHDSKLEPEVWLDSYVRTYIERDVRTLTNVGDLDAFTRFVKLCAGRAGQQLNMSAIGSDAGVDQATVKRWISILRAGYVIDLLQPHYNNFKKRLVKTPKLYFHDTGLLCNLLGIRSPDQFRHHPLRGAVFENFVVTELRKVFVHNATPPALYYWRDSRGREVDVIMERGVDLLPVEIKAGQTVTREFFGGLDYYTKLSGGRGGILVYGGTESYVRRGHRVCPWSGLRRS